MGKINVAIIGVGNCASSLVQGIHKYREIPDDEAVPGLMHPAIGGYEIGDINIVAAFDVDNNKVGKDLSEAVFAKPNNTIRIADVPPTGVTVDRGMTHDGLGKYVSGVVEKAPGHTFGGAPINLELKLEVWDSPNSVGVVVDAIRCCKLALDRGESGAVHGPSAYFMKSPPIQYTDDVARQMVEDFISDS